MNDNSDLQDFHIGNIIRETADRQGVAAAALATVLEPPRYRGNEEKIFRIKDFHIGDYCREVARAKNMNGKYIARRMGCSAGSVRHYFRQKDMKLGTAVMLSRALEHNLIAEIYLIRTDFGGTPLFGDGGFDVAMRAKQPFSTGNVAGGAFVWSFSTQKSEKKQAKTKKNYNPLYRHAKRLRDKDFSILK